MAGAAASPVFARVLVLCLLIGLVEGYDLQSMALAVPTLAREWRLPPEAFSSVLAASTLGILIGSILIGPLGDRVQRSRIVTWSCVVFGVGSFAAAMATSLHGLFLARFAIGFAAGVCTPSTYALIADHAPALRRTQSLTAMTCMISLGSFAGGILAPPLLRSHSWPALFLLGGVASFALAGALALGLRGPEVAERQQIAPRPVGAPSVLGLKGVFQPLGSLLGSGTRRQTLLLWLLWTINSFTFYALANWLPTLMAQSGFPLGVALNLSVMIWIGGIAGGLLLSWLFDRLPRRGALLAATLAGGALLLALLLWLPKDQYVWGLLLFGAGTTIGGVQAMIPAVAATVYPATSLATGLSWGGAVSRCGALLAPMLGGWAIGQAFGTATLLGLLAVPALMAAVAAALLLRGRGRP